MAQNTSPLAVLFQMWRKTERGVGGLWWREGFGHSVPANASYPSLLFRTGSLCHITHWSSASMHRDALLLFAPAGQEAATHVFCSVCCWNADRPNIHRHTLSDGKSCLRVVHWRRGRSSTRRGSISHVHGMLHTNHALTCPPSSQLLPFSVTVHFPPPIKTDE